MMSRYATVQSVRNEVNRLASFAHDDERAHQAEVELFRDVLRTIANGENDDTAAELAQEALKSGNIDFARCWS